MEFITAENEIASLAMTAMNLSLRRRRLLQVNGSIRVILLFFYHAVDIINKYPCFAKRNNR